jgi:hypothetical protein
MPMYQFAIKWADDQSPDTRYLHLEDEEAARRYAKLLIKELASSGFDSSRSCILEVKDESDHYSQCRSGKLLPDRKIRSPYLPRPQNEKPRTEIGG